MGYESRCGLSWVLCSEPLTGCTQGFHWSCSHLKAQLGRICFQDHSRGYAQNSVPHGLLDGGLWFVCSGWLEVSLTSLARGPFQATSHNTTANFIQGSKWEESESSCQQDGSHNLLRPDLGRDVSLPLMYSIMSKSLGPVDVQREGITRWQE